MWQNSATVYDVTMGAQEAARIAGDASRSGPVGATRGKPLAALSRAAERRDARASTRSRSPRRPRRRPPSPRSRRRGRPRTARCWRGWFLPPGTAQRRRGQALFHVDCRRHGLMIGGCQMRHIGTAWRDCCGELLAGGPDRASTVPAWPEPLAILTEGLTKRYGETVALDRLDLTVAAGRGVRLPRSERRGQDDDDPAAARAAPADRGPGASCSASTRGATRSTAHRRVAYVAGEPSLWPSLTGAETLEFLARLRGGTDRAYRDVLVERFQLDASKKVRALSKGNRQKVAADRGARQPGRPAAARRADERARPADGGRVSRVGARGQGARPDGLPVVAHPQRGRGAVRPGRHPARRAAGRRGDARRAAPPQRPDGRRDVRAARRRSCRRCAGVHVVPAGPNSLRFEVTGQHRPAASPRSPSTGRAR